MSNEAKYRAKVLNVDGYVVMFPNVGVGVPKVTFPPNPYAESETQLFPLGTKLIQGERVWRYCRAGSNDLNIAAPVEGPTIVHAHQNYNIAVISGAKDGTTIVLTSTTDLDGAPNNEVNAFAEGYFFVNDEAGQGQCYKIKSNTALSGTEDFTVELYDALTILLTTNSECGLLHSPYNKVIATTTATANMVIGVPLLTVTQKYYFWCQSGGPAPVVTDGNQVLGTMVVVGKTAAKADPMSALTTEVIIGYPMTPCETSAETFMCFLTLDR